MPRASCRGVRLNAAAPARRDGSWQRRFPWPPPGPPRADIRQRHPRVLHPPGNGQADAAGAACTGPESVGSCSRNSALRHAPARPRRRYRPGESAHPGVTRQGQAVKLPLPQHVGQRLPCPAARPVRRGSMVPADLLRRVQVPAWPESPPGLFPEACAQQLPRQQPRPLLPLPGFQQRMPGVQSTARRIASPTVSPLLLRQHGLYQGRNPHLDHGVVRLVGGEMLQPHARRGERPGSEALSYRPHPAVDLVGHSPPPPAGAAA